MRVPQRNNVGILLIFVREVLGVSPGQRAFVANGLVVGPFGEEEEIIDSDVELVERIVETQGAGVIASHIDKWELKKEDGYSSDVVMRSFALLAKYAVSRKRTWIVLGEDEHSTVTLVAEDSNRPVLDVVAVVDPLTRSAQKLAPILDVLRKTVNCDLKIVLNPKPKLSEMPLKRYYRYVVAPELQFDKAGKVAANQARFTNLPSKQLLTLSLHSPSAWMVENVFAEVDLDNILMDQVSLVY
ncbi:UDP-glucose:Glycoprotein Glucosyltransferase [Ancylostoma caninum]|uniref:UDP-glucose:Glycoprotein Glucosyltransferase n=1 Tax=Ancylostoma caninum TaxID=29170 RepID=A0A368G9W3_ANCCA|nr:UDP-glucose:Glycoprotein Glucosyltransferase [Ancylostoma caninum]